MFRSLSRSASALSGRVAWPRPRWYTTNSGKISEPLRILFCGTDPVSAESLNALYREWEVNRELVEHIECAVIPPKPSGRGLKMRIESPCMTAVKEMGLPMHQLDSFRGWELPEHINLIVAVSFGLFVPSRILNKASYGGLNVHPSFLPDLRGPAPIHHALLRGDKYLGASLQTMDDKKFDHGVVLAQTPSPGLEVTPDETLPEVTQKLAIECADLLIEGLRDGVHVPPHVNAGWKGKELEGKTLQHAPKIDKADMEVDWADWSAEEWRRRLQLQQGVWTKGAVTSAKRSYDARRVIIHDGRQASADEVKGLSASMEFVQEKGNGGPRRFRKVVAVDTQEGVVYIQLADRKWIRAEHVTLEGKPRRPASTGLKDFIIQE